MSENQSSPSLLKFFFPWIMILVASPIGIIPWRTAGIDEPIWVPLLHGGILAVLLLSTLFHATLRPHRRFAVIINILFFMGYGGGWTFGLIPYIRSTAAWLAWEATGPTALYQLSLHSLRLTPALVILTSLVLSGRKRVQFFLVKGDRQTIFEDSKILKTKTPTTWTKMALIFTVIFIVAVSVILFGQADFSTLTIDWFLVPVAILVAAMNGFNEEFALRAAPLGELEPEMGKSDSLIVTATYFGLGHYFGVPSGILGVILSAFLGWFLGKSMLETKGIFLAWLVHFLTDIPIFLFFIAVSF
ncbi:CPBP family intramembrane metalloprotease [Candidatus Thorarchaeota archaeon]|nr:MAG: CPBP family intramembrane metalloprotease [Candidatus Thorarchaeota archaeon]